MLQCGKTETLTKLLGVSRSTIYNYLGLQILKAKQFRGKTIIRRSDIDKLFDEVGASDGKSADEINNGLTRLSKSIKDTVLYFEEKRKKPTADEFKAAYMIIKDSITPDKSDNHKPENNGKKEAFENQDNKRSIQGNESSEQRFNKLSDSEKDKNKEDHSSFWNAYHEYETYAGKLNVWSENTRKRHEAISNNLKSFRDWKRKNGYPDFEVTFDYFDEKGVQSYVDYLCEVKMFVNSTIRKDVLILKTVIR